MIERHHPHFRPSHQSTQVSLEESRISCGGNACEQIRVVGEKLHITLDDIRQVINIDQEEQWTEYRALW